MVVVCVYVCVFTYFPDNLLSNRKTVEEMEGISKVLT